MTQTPDNTAEPRTSTPRRGEDDRRSTVNPADSPAPRSPEADADAVRKGEEKLRNIAPSSP